jgi:3D-(3,5/4)-trihydroxycyclohexane-1,2-dione acylhydrolase (decyclizing)
MAGDATIRLTAGQAVVRFLAAQHSERDGVTRRAIPGIFGIFGHGNVLGIAQGIEQDGAELPLYQPKNEQAMVHTALGVAKASRRLVTLACTASIGPGSTNMLTGAATATINRLPVLLLPSDTFANRKQGPVLQQLEHPVDADLTVNDAFRPVSRFFDRISRPEQLITALPQAMRVLLDPAETGAVTISIHQDVQGESYDFPAALFEHRVWHVARRPAEAGEIARALDVLRSAQHPMVIAGGGVRYSEAEHELRRLVEKLGIPVAETSAGKGALTSCKWVVGGMGVNGTRVANQIAAEADVVLTIGTRLTDFITGSHSAFQHPDVRFIGVNVNAADAHKLGATPIVADAREALRALREAAGDQPLAGRDGRLAAVMASNSTWRDDLTENIAAIPGKPIGQGEVLATLNAEVTTGDWVVAAAGWQPGDLLKLWEAPAGSFTHIEFGASCMGHEIQAGLGIRLHIGDTDHPGSGEVFVVIGDGTYLMNPTELFTAVQEGLKLTVVLLVNGGYQSINALAVGKTGRPVGNEFRRRGTSGRLPDGERIGVDFVANAASMGCVATLATDADQLRAALAAARDSDAVSVIVVPTDPDRALLPSGSFWDLGVPTVAADAGVAALSRDHLEQATRQRFYV